jgi:hypothetical protein
MEKRKRKRKFILNENYNQAEDNNKKLKNN